jgi:hypothetical protein
LPQKEENNGPRFPCIKRAAIRGLPVAATTSCPVLSLGWLIYSEESTSSDQLIRITHPFPQLKKMANSIQSNPTTKRINKRKHEYTHAKPHNPNPTQAFGDDDEPS